jgi:hypothetical protein
MPLSNGNGYGRIKKHLFEIFLILLFIFAAIKVLRVEWPF